MKARTLLDRIIIKQDEAKNMMGNFVLSDTAKERPREGVVVVVGPKTEMAKVGDKVGYGEFSGMNIRIEDEEYVTLKEGELLYIL